MINIKNMINFNDTLMEPIVAQKSSLRIAIVTETFPPEVNGVAMTLGRIVRGLVERGHSVQLVRPRQSSDGEIASFEGVDVVGVTAGASAPEVLVQEVIDQLKAWGGESTTENEGIEEKVVFSLPRGLKK